VAPEVVAVLRRRILRDVVVGSGVVCPVATSVSDEEAPVTEVDGDDGVDDVDDVADGDVVADDRPDAPDRSVPTGPGPCFANAYAITYRLLGERNGARATAEAVAGSYLDRESEDASLWLPELATDAVVASLLAADAPLHDGPDDLADTPVANDDPTATATAAAAADSAAEPEEDPSSVEQRRFLRSRLATLDGRGRAAAALVHLAGYDARRVAAVMGADEAEIEELAAPLAPPPGESWRRLGDPVVRGEASAVRRPRRRRVVPWKSLTAVVVLMGLVAFAGSLTGPRPTLGRADPGAGDRHFGSDVEPVPSSGCDVVADSPVEPGVSAESIDSPGGSAAFRLSTPEDPSTPAPLLVVLPGYGQTAEQFAASAQLDQALPEALTATLEPPAPALEWNGGGDPAASDDRATAVAVTEDLIMNRCVDLARVHAVGFGPGAQLAGSLACGSPEIYASVAMVGGSFMPEQCRLRPAVAALLTANVDDPVIRPTGGYGPSADDQPGTGSFERAAAEPMDDVARRWASAVGASEVETRAESDDTLVQTRTGEGGVEVLSVLHPGGGHSWGYGDTVTLVDFLDRSARSG
jgi:polyhydroxybutyrate depolymerase